MRSLFIIISMIKVAILEYEKETTLANLEELFNTKSEGTDNWSLHERPQST
mgnify:CR=1 FL=1